MGSHSSLVLKRVWLMGIVFACLLALMCSVKPARTYAGVPDPIRIVYKYNNGMDSTLTTATPPVFLGLPDNPTFENRLFLGWFARSASGATHYFGWDWRTAEDEDGPPSDVFRLIANFTPTDWSISSDTTVTAQWANINPAVLNTTYQHMLSQNSPLWKMHPVQVYSCSLTAGTTYHIQTWLPGGDSYLYMFDDTLKLIDEDDDSCADYTQGEYGYGYLNRYGSYIEYTPTKSGTYYFFNATYSDYDEPEDHGMSFFRIGTSFLAEPRVCVTWISSGSSIDHTYYEPGQMVNARTAPTKRGYTFAGWYKNAILTDRIDFSNFKMPTSDINIFARWTSNESHLRGLKKSTGTFTQRWRTTNYINRLRISRYVSKVTIRPLRSDSRSTVYMKYKGGTYRNMSSMKLTLRRGQTRTVYIKCVSQTGPRYTSIYKIFVTRNR